MKRFGPVLVCLIFEFLVPSCARSQAPEGLPAPVLGEVRDTRGLPAGRYTLARQWTAEGRMAAHQIGRSIVDPRANGGRAWEARVGRDGASLYLLYGPYIEAAPGDYVAFFRLKLLEEAGEEGVATLDAAVSYGQDILATREIAGADLALNRYVEVPLPFRYAGGRLECRVLWRGYASLRLDRVSQYRVEGASFRPFIARAEPAAPSGQPRDLAYRPAAAGSRPSVHNRRLVPGQKSEIFPRSSPPARHLVLFDLRRVPPDMQLLLLSLQGLVNRSQPRIYCIFQATDPDWLRWMQRRGWTGKEQVVSRPEELLRRFRRSYRGVIVTDPALPASKNVATMLAGVRGGLVASPRLAGRLRLPVLDDLRGRWRTSVDAYRWAFDRLWPRLSHRVIACSYPDHLGLRDYLVEQKVFIFWISGPIDGARPYANPTAEARLMERLFARMPPNIPVMSYPWAGKDIGIGEGPGVTLFAEFAKYLVGSIRKVYSGRVPGRKGAASDRLWG